MALTKRKPKKVIRRRKLTGSAGAPLDDYKKCTNYFHFEVDAKEASAITKAFLKKKYNKDEYKTITKLPEWNFTYRHIAAYCHWTNNDLTAPEESQKWMNNKFAEWLEKAKPLAEKEQQVEKQKKNVYTPNIQERIREVSGEIIGQIEEIVDQFISDPKKFKSPDIVKLLRSLNVNQAHTRHIINFYKPSLDEFTLLLNPPKIKDKMNEQQKDIIGQIKEGYSDLTKNDIKKGYEFYSSIVNACNMIITESKANRKTRKPVAKSATKLVAKLKYLATDEKYKTASVNPVEIIGSTELWVFNVKTRKIGKYVAQEARTLTVKGTTIQDFDTDLSIAKTLRKPDTQLTEFNKCTKVQLRKYLDKINSVDVKLNGRINADTVLLKAVK